MKSTLRDSKVGIVWNPSKCDREDIERDAMRVLRHHKLPSKLYWYETTVVDPGTEAARQAITDGCTLIIAVGGDGTVRAVADGAAKSGVHLGIVPKGTGNLLARNTGVPLNDVEAALERCFTSPGSALDLVRAEVERKSGTETHGFLVMAGFGIDAQMLAETHDELKGMIGWAAYAEAMGRAIAATDLVGITLSTPEGPPFRTEAHTIIIGNCGTITGGLTLFPNAQVDDGLFDAIVVSASSFLGWASTIKNVLWDHGIKRWFSGRSKKMSDESSTHILRKQYSEMRIDLDEPQPFEIDGEEIGEVSAVTFRVDAGALTLR